MTDYEKSGKGIEEAKSGKNSLSTDEYYTKACFDGLLAQKADVAEAELETYEICPDLALHPGWKISFQRLGMGVVTVTVKATGLSASAGSPEYYVLATGIPERFRPNYNLYYVGADINSNKRTIGLMANGEIHIYHSVSVGCYGSVTYVTNH